LQGFKIIFEFSDNPFFSNKELVKTYYMVSDDAADPVLQKATGTNVQWANGKNPGVKVTGTMLVHDLERKKSKEHIRPLGIGIL